MFSNIKAVIFDLDGTIYYGNSVIDGAIDTIDHMKKLGKKVFYLTNNSTKSRLQVYEKLKNMGIDCKIEEVYTSGYISTIYAKKEGIRNIFILGSDDLKDEFSRNQIEVVDDENLAEHLLIGYDTKFDYDRMTRALNVALKGNTIIACNKERHFPGENARRMPGCGAMVGAIEHCTDRKVDLVIGKPNTLMLDILSEINGLSNDEILMIGDTYESDIKMANKFGCKSILISDEEFEDTNSVLKIIDIINLLNNNMK
ncbi:MAG: HAD-IIA family hydrolase, partial [Clostridium celatum]|nr:HAD-IIA family hydrolase [Clostridium celatum]